MNVMQMISTALILCAGTLSAADTLFKNQKSDWKIVISPTASEVEHFAAEDLQQTLEQISGAKIPVVRTEELSSRNNIILGTPESSKIVAKMKEQLRLTKDPRDEISVFVLEQNLYLCGNRPRSVLYAVQDFLQKELGVRNFWQGNDGTFLKKRDEYVLQPLAKSYRSPFQYRQLGYSGMPNQELSMAFMARNFINLGPDWFQKGHARYGFEIAGTCHSVHLNPKLYESKPEMFSMIGGKRVKENDSRGCWSNPETVEYLIRKQSDEIKKYSLTLLYSYPSDNGNYCTCPECSKNPDLAGRWFQFYAKMVHALKKEHPALKTATIAYQEYAKVPEKPVEEVEFVNYCQYDRCYVHKLSDPKCERNKNSMARLAEWEKKAPMGIYGYELDIFNPKIMVPFGHMLEDELKTFAARNIRSVYMEGSGDPKFKTHGRYAQNPNRFNNYLYAQLAWDPSQNTDGILQDWCQTLYGPAAPPMKDYHNMLMNAWDKMPIHISYFFNNYIGTARYLLNETLIAGIRKKFAEAEKIAGTISDPSMKKQALEQIAIEKNFFLEWINAYQVSSKTFALVHLPETDSFAHAAQLPLQSKNGTHQKTTLKAYYTKEALHLQVDCVEPNMNGLNKIPENCFGDDTIEILLDTRTGNDYHLALGLGGKTYFAKNREKNPSAKWLHTVQERKDGWTVNIVLPFQTLGMTPRKNMEWGFALNRNGKPEACGFPYPVYGDLASVGTIRFAGKSPVPGTLVIVNSSLPLRRYLEKNWNTVSFDREKIQKADLTQSNIFFVNSLQNKMQVSFFRKKLFPHIAEHGGIVFFQAYGGLPLEEYTGDVSWNVKFKEGFSKPREIRYAVDCAVVKTPNLLEKIMPAWGFSSVYLPVAKGEWKIAAEAKLRDGNWGPVLLYRPYGKGYVFLATGGEQLPVLLENIVLLK